MGLLFFLEKKIKKIQFQRLEKKNVAFLRSNHLVDKPTDKFECSEFNGYQLTDVSLCKALLKSGAIASDDSILDVGCGCGVFMFFLLKNGYRNVDGVEIKEDLFKIAESNLTKLPEKVTFSSRVYLLNVIDAENKFFDKYNVFYLFNPFNDEVVWDSFFNKIHDSLLASPRKIKVIFLYMNAICKKSVSKVEWLKRGKSIVDKDHYCSSCIKFTVYENI